MPGERGCEQYSRGRRIGVYEKIPEVQHTDARQVCTLAVRQIPPRSQTHETIRTDSRELFFLNETWKKLHIYQLRSSDLVQEDIFVWERLAPSAGGRCGLAPYQRGNRSKFPGRSPAGPPEVTGFNWNA